MEPIECQFHLCENPEEPLPDPLPETTSDKAFRDGWRQTTNRLFSPDGQPVWICPDCVLQLCRHLHDAKQDQEDDAARGYRNETEDIEQQRQRALQDAQRAYAAKLTDIERRYQEALLELAGDAH